MEKSKTINQHYVPRFLLEAFSDGNKKTPRLNIYDIERRQERKNQSIKEVFSQNYFYDKDNTVEGFIERHIESPASKLVEKIKNNDLTILNNGNTDLIKFICCQMNRTVEAREDVVNFINASFEQLKLSWGDKNGYNRKDIEGISLGLNGKDSERACIAQHAISGVINSKGMEDLKFHMLINTTDCDFFISDHPVTRYNWFYRELNPPEVGSLLAKGVQLFLPISPKMTICVYDSDCYKYGSSRRDFSFLTNEVDIEWLNGLQARAARSFIGYSKNSKSSDIISLTEKLKNKKIYNMKSKNLTNLGYGNPDELHMAYTEQVKLSNKPSFFKVLKKSMPLNKKYHERDPDVSAALLMLKEHANQVSRSRI